MKRNLILAILIVIMAITCLLGLVACNNNNTTTEGIGHLLSYYSPIESTCTAEGVAGHWLCSECNKIFLDSEGKNEVDRSQLTLPKKPHTWGERTDVKEPTCTNEGSYKHQCEVCGNEQTETMPATGHTLTAHTALGEDCTHIGQVAYWQCDVCAKYYVDLDAVKEISFADTFVAPSGHTYSEWQVTKEATCLQDGEKVRSCNCGYSQTEVIYAKGHQIVGGKCSLCQAPETSGLKFELNSDQTGYICVGWDNEVNNNSQDKIDLIIPAQYNGLNVVEVKSFTGDTRICSITLPDTVTKIGNSAFSNCTSLERLYIPSSVKNIGNSAFANCTGLKLLKIHSSVTLGNSVFEGCTNLTTAIIPNWALNYIPRANLQTIELTTGVTVYSLEGCVSLKKLIVSDDFSVVATDAFTDCVAMELTEYGNAYYLGNAENEYAILVKAVSKDIQTCFVHENTKAIAYSAFADCQNLEVVTIPQNSKLNSIGASAFSNCSALEAIYLPQGLSIIEEYAFYKCRSLQSINIPDTVYSLGQSSFQDCTSLKEVYVSNRVTFLRDNTFNNCVSIVSLSIPAVTELPDNAFTGCNSVKNIVMTMDAYPYFDKEKFEDLTITKGDVPDIAFSYLVGLKKVTIGKGVREVGVSAFENSFVETLIIEEGLQRIGFGAFRCLFIETLHIPKSVNSISMCALEHNRMLKEFTVDSENEYYVAVDGVLFNKDMNELLYYPAKKESKTYKIPDNVQRLWFNSFYSCTNLTEIILGKFTVTIESGAFGHCENLTSIVLPFGVTDIYQDTFMRCTNLKSITIPATVKYIGNDVFNYSTQLTDIIYQGTIEQWNSINKEQTNGKWDADTTDYIIHCLDADIKKDGTIIPLQ